MTDQSSQNKIETSVTEAKVIWSEDQYLFSEEFDDFYFSSDDGLQETIYVFLQANNIHERFRKTWERWEQFAQSELVEKNNTKVASAHLSQPKSDSTFQSFNIIETGFGTGLSFLATAQAWSEARDTVLQATKNSFNNSDISDFSHSTPSPHIPHLHFISIEKFPLTKEVINRALEPWPELEEFRHALVKQYPEITKGFHRIHFDEFNLTLTLVFDDVSEALPQLDCHVNAWYLDGFAPAKNPDMWDETLFKNMTRLSHQTKANENETTFATFTAATMINRSLAGSGFKVKKQSGFGKKREMLKGHYIGMTGPQPSPYFYNKPWFTLPNRSNLASGEGVEEFNQPSELSKQKSTKSSNEQCAVVVGGGLAGASTAYALAKRGWKVTVIEKNSIASGASGNSQGVLYAKLSADSSSHGAFYLAGYLYSLNLLNHQLDGVDWQSCGVLQLALSEKEETRQQKFLSQAQLPTSVVHGVNRKEATTLANSDIPSGGLFFPNGGWVNPPSLCRALLNHPNISILEHTSASEYQFISEEDRWSLKLSKTTTTKSSTIKAPTIKAPTVKAPTTHTEQDQSFEILSTSHLIICSAYESIDDQELLASERTNSLSDDVSNKSPRKGPRKNPIVPHWALPIKAIRGQVSTKDIEQSSHTKGNATTADQHAHDSGLVGLHTKEENLKDRIIKDGNINKQLTNDPIKSNAASLATVICGKGYVSPLWQNQLNFGATFDLNSTDQSPNQGDHQKNLDMLKQQAPDLGREVETDNILNSLVGRVGFRCSSPDYMPIAGPLADFDSLLTTYTRLRKKADEQFYQPPQYQPGLFINIGHGSRGLISAPLCGEIIACQLNNEPLPIEQDLANRLHPSRFVIRNMIRNKL